MDHFESDWQAIVNHFKDGEFDLAKQQCESWLQANPGDGKAWHLFGLISGQTGDLTGATQALERAITLSPEIALYRYNLGLALQGQERWQDAAESYRQALLLRPDFAEALNNLGNCLLQMDDVTGSADVFRELIRSFPDDSIIHFNCANVLEEIGQYEESLAAMRRAIELDPGFDSARENLGRTLTGIARFDEAAQVWREWLEYDPDNAIAKHMYASVSNEADLTPDRCDDEYVRQTFDQNFASSYDQQLARIQYRVPELIMQAIAETGQPKFENVLDAGCGTGLCATRLRPLSQTLVGVDLSSEMLTRAERRDQYDQLHEAELTQFLNATGDRYDLIISADTLCYFGDLTAILSAMCGRLRADGWVVFSCESADESGDSASLDQSTFQLTASGRYRHHERYVRDVANRAGLRCCSIRRDWLRMERGAEVAGLIATLRR